MAEIKISRQTWYAGRRNKIINCQLPADPKGISVAAVILAVWNHLFRSRKPFTTTTVVSQPSSRFHRGTMQMDFTTLFSPRIPRIVRFSPSLFPFFSFPFFFFFSTSTRARSMAIAIFHPLIFSTEKHTSIDYPGLRNTTPAARWRFVEGGIE